MIPIQNIYYLLAYAWNKLPVGGRVPIEAESGPELIDLLARMLLEVLPRFFANGTSRYQPHKAVGTTLKGRIDLNASLRQDLLRRGRLVCSFESLDVDHPANRVVKATLETLVRYPHLAADLRAPLRRYYLQMDAVGVIDALRETDFIPETQGSLPNQRWVYHLCQLIYHLELPRRGKKGVLGRELVEDPRQMPHLFESFVRNFYRFHRRDMKPGRETIRWQWNAREATAAKLPPMYTDVSLRAPGHHIIMDTKYFPGAVRGRQNHLRPTHLYQLNAYLRNKAPTLPEAVALTGVLLYPAVGRSRSITYEAKESRIWIQTVLLDQAWRDIQRELLELPKKIMVEGLRV